MSKALKVTFGIHAVLALIFGAALLVAPGQFLALFNWRSQEAFTPIMSRLLGAAMIALAWSSFLGVRTKEISLEKAFIQTELIFCVLGAVGLARHLLFTYYPWPAWAVFIVLVIFAILWLIFLLKKRQ